MLAVKTISLQTLDCRDTKSVLLLFTVQNVSCIMMHGLMYRMFLDKLKKEVGMFFFNQNVKSVKILMMSGIAFCFCVLDF